MIVELGHYCLVLALTLALLQCCFSSLGAWKNDGALLRLAAPLAVGQLLFVVLAFGALTYAYIVSDFSVATVVENSHSAKPLIYRITGVWGNHEGSMLLWVLVLCIFGTAFAGLARDVPPVLRASVLSVQGLIACAFLFFILLTSNPFGRSFPPPLEGNDLNPLLQDIGLAIHPPLLYLGYVGFSICYAFAISALISGQAGRQWARAMRIWCLAAWIFLTLGIAMGSYWAYYELGWGGIWFWDPVENASFMPWLAGTILLHSALVTEKRGALSRWTLLLSIAAFSLSLIGTFLVRSGVLTSVHAFAVDPARGVAILLILALFIGGGLVLYALRAPKLATGEDFSPVSRESALVLNNVFLSAATVAVFTGTLYPLFLEVLTGEKISVGPPYFNLTFTLLIVPMLLLMPFGPLLAWKHGRLDDAMRRMSGIVAIGALVAVALLWQQPWHILTAAGLALSAYVMAGALAEPFWRVQLFAIPLRESFARLRAQRLSHFGTTLAHFGVGLFLWGVVCASAFSEEKTVTLQQGESVALSSYVLMFDRMETRTTPTYDEQEAQFTIRRGGGEIGHISSAKRLYRVRNYPTTEAGLFTTGVSQLYLSLAEVQDGAVVMRLYYKSQVLLIWLGCVVIALGGLAALMGRVTRRNQ